MCRTTRPSRRTSPTREARRRGDFDEESRYNLPSPFAVRRRGLHQVTSRVTHRGVPSGVVKNESGARKG
jgi:hypothetical protein